MDLISAKPLEANNYLDKHKILPLFQELLQQIIVNKPVNPIEFLIKYLSVSHGPKILIIGPPLSGKSTLAKLIAEKYNLVHFSPQQLLSDAAEVSEENEAKKYINSEPPEEYILDLIQTKINTDECKQKGWIMEGYPFTKTQALLFQSSGILVDKVVILEADEQQLHPRAVQQNTVEKFQQALQSYQKNIKGVFECYKTIAKRVPVGDELLSALDSIKTYLDSKTA